jgi:hypothetical protein
LQLDRVVDHDRIAEPRAAVDDAVGHRSHVSRDSVERLKRCSSAVRGDDRELQARRACVDDEY